MKKNKLGCEGIGLEAASLALSLGAIRALGEDQKSPLRSHARQRKIGVREAVIVAAGDTA